MVVCCCARNKARESPDLAACAPDEAQNTRHGSGKGSFCYGGWKLWENTEKQLFRKHPLFSGRHGNRPRLIGRAYTLFSGHPILYFLRWLRMQLRLIRCCGTQRTLKYIRSGALAANTTNLDPAKNQQILQSSCFFIRVPVSASVLYAGRLEHPITQKAWVSGDGGGTFGFGRFRIFLVQF